LTHPSLPEPTAIFLGRVSSLLAGLAAVWLLFAILRKRAGDRAAVAASLFLVASPAWLFSSSVMKNDSLLLVCILVLLYACFQILESGRRRDYLLAGFGLGLCLAMKFHVFGLVPLAAAHLLRARRSRRLIDQNLILSLMLALVFFVLLSPFHFLHPLSTIKAIALEIAFQSHSVALFKARSNLWYQAPVLFQLLCVFPWAMGILGYLAALAGIAFARKSLGSKAFWLFLSYPLGFLLGFGFLSRLGYVHLYLPLCAFLAGFAGIFIDRLLSGKTFSRVLAGMLMLATISLQSLGFANLNRAQSDIVFQSLEEAQRLTAEKIVVFFPYRPLAGSAYAEIFTFLPQFFLTSSWLGHFHPPYLLVHQSYYAAYLNHPEIESAEAYGFAELREGKAGYRRQKEWKARLGLASVDQYFLPDLKDLSVGLYGATSSPSP